MLNVNSVAANLNSLFNSASTESADGSFAQVFSSRMNSLKASSTVSDLLASISEKFPNATVKETSVGKGTDGVEKAFGTEAGDYVGIDSGTLASMLSSTNLMEKIEEALSSFFGSAAGENTVSGAYSQRSVTITITTITFQSAQRSSDTGEVLSSQELQSALQDKIRELVEKFFGKGTGTTGETAEESDSETTDETAGTEAAETGKNDLWGSSLSSFSWSMQLFYSNTLIQSMSNGGNGNQSMMSMSSMSAMAFASSYQAVGGDFQNFANSYAPQSILSQLGKNGTNNNSTGTIAQLLDGGLGLMGLTSGGFSQTTDGFNLSLRNGRDFLSELLDLAGRSSVSSATGGDGVEAASEAPVDASVAGV